MNPLLEAIFHDAPLEHPIKLPDGWPAGLLDSSQDIMEHLRHSLPHAVSSGEHFGARAYLFCSKDLDTEAPGDCLYQLRLRPDRVKAADAAEAHAISALFATVSRGIAHFGEAHAVAILSLGHVLTGSGSISPCWMIHVLRRGRGAELWVSMDKYNPNRPSTLPSFRPWEDGQDGKMVDVYGVSRMLDPLPPMAPLMLASQYSGFGVMDLVRAWDTRDTHQVCVVMESHRSLHMTLPTRHRLRVVIVDVAERSSFMESEGGWSIRPADVQSQASHVLPPLRELGLLMQDAADAAAETQH